MAFYKAIPLQALDWSLGSRRLRLSDFLYDRHMKVVRLSVSHTGRLYPPRMIHGTNFCYRMSRLQGHSAAARIESMKSSNDPIGYRIRNLPACSAVSNQMRHRVPCFRQNTDSIHAYSLCKTVSQNTRPKN